MVEYDSTPDTNEHISRVRHYLDVARDNLYLRGQEHDRSKLHPPEKEAFDRGTQALKGLTYGSDEYRESFAKHGMKDAIAHHYAHNSHHPEHWPNGVSDMSLLDMIEMLVDWRAASQRHENGDIWKSIDHNVVRFDLDPQVACILRNTAKELGW